MLQRMIMNNKKTSAIILAGVAAFAYYKYSKMSPEEKANMRSTLKEKGTAILDNMMPFGLKNVFSKSGRKSEATSPVM